MVRRRKTRPVMVGAVGIGGSHPITVQSMTTTPTHQVAATVRQIHRLAKAGCDIVRVAVPDLRSARSLQRIKERITIPLVADIHFNHRLALIAIDQGVDKVRINPGNIGSAVKVREVAGAARAAGIPIRVGVNSGSLDPGLKKKHRGDIARALVASALQEVTILERARFQDLVVSLKASDVFDTVKAYRALSRKVPYPVHLGVTEAGPVRTGTVVSVLGIGSLLWQGIGDTIRVSLTGDPAEEVRVGNDILRALALRRDRPRLISCPTCGRCSLDLIKIANEVDRRLALVRKPITVAVMGCVVNGPGEAREADIGIAGGRGSGWLFKKGVAIRKVKEKDLVNVLLKEVEAW